MISKIYLNENVFEAAKDRIRYVLSEFDEILVWISGGKDSTVIFNLVRDVAEELGRLPINVGFIDQEAEWEGTIEQVKRIMYRTDVKPYWFQMPFKLSNSTSTSEDFLYCWDVKEEARWVREKDPISIKENTYGVDRFHKLFEAISSKEFAGKRLADFGGVRSQESPVRHCSLTTQLAYKGITWGKKHKNPEHRTFYPIYDWGYTDVWKAIYDNKWDYNRIYDAQYQYGINIKDMRISSLHHETSLMSLFYMAEVEPDNYNRLVARIGGINTAATLGWDDYFITDLPFMFKDWKEYRDYLLDKLIPEKHKENFRKIFASIDALLEGQPKDILDRLPSYSQMMRTEVNAILCNDYENTKLHNAREAWALKIRTPKEGYGM